MDALIYGLQQPPGRGEVAWLELMEAWEPKWPQLLTDSSGLMDELGLQLETDWGWERHQSPRASESQRRQL